MRQGGGRLGWILIGLVAVALVGAAVWLVVGGGGTKPVTLTGNRAPALLLADADAAMNKVATMRYTMTATFSNLPGGGNQPSQLTLSGEIVRPDRYTMRSPLIGEIVVIGKDSWLKRPGTSDWAKQTGDTGLGGLIDPNSLADSSKYYTDVLRLNDEAVDGVDCYHLKFGVDSGKLKAANAGLAIEGANIAAEVWVGKEDHLQRRMSLVITLPSNGASINSTVDIKLAGFNDSITIDAPQ